MSHSIARYICWGMGGTEGQLDLKCKLLWLLRSPIAVLFWNCLQEAVWFSIVTWLRWRSRSRSSEGCSGVDGGGGGGGERLGGGERNERVGQLKDADYGSPPASLPTNDGSGRLTRGCSEKTTQACGLLMHWARWGSLWFTTRRLNLSVTTEGCLI